MKKSQGFTLIELMITIAIAGVLIAIALPSFNETIQNNRMVTNTNEIVGALNYARAQAVSRGSDVRIEGRSGGGIVVWIDDNANDSYDDGEELRFWEPFANGITFNSSAADAFIFNSRGGLDSSATISVCDSTRTTETGREVTLLVSGLIAVEDKVDCG